MKLSAIRYLVLDEADRMLEPGHFKDLDSLLESLSPVVVLDDEVRKKATKKKNAKHVRRTFLFSATLLPEKALKDDGKFRKTPKKIVNKSNIRGSEGNVIPTISDLVQKLDFSDNNPVYINLVEQKITANGIMESKIECLAKDKDAYLYYILSRYVGRTIVFVNSIDSIRRIVPLLTLLKVKCWGIHAEMQQRQRLKNLENFSKCVDGILISSDVSARGLDINSIDHVIHYHLPRTADLFVHRSGRTGRGSKEGVVVALIAPPEVKVLRRILHGLDRSDDMAVFPVDHDVMSQIKERVALANAVDEQEHKLSKLSHEKSWLKTTAMDMDLIVDESRFIYI